MLAIDLQESRTANPDREIHFVWPNGDRITIRAIVANKGRARLQIEGISRDVKIHKGRLTSLEDSANHSS